ncbi:MAG: helix-turn-helix transcriptional regulator [Candidatus Roizmanbacteria bacterium]|nr:helix-turn-helix transcriptional regulator [Candidatus Roizmanbacteria bacterium]
MRENFFYRRLGEVIFKVREKRKLTQEQLSLLCDLNRTYLSRIEKGKANPSVKILNKICRVLKIKIGNLLKGL